MLYLAIAGALFLVWLLVVIFFTPAINYHLRGRVGCSSRDFLYTLQSTCQTALHHGNSVTILTNGEAFYPAMLAAIRGATRSINLECYIFLPGAIAEQFIDALTERARNGVIVSVVLDFVGSFRLRGDPVRRLSNAGCRVEWYQGFHWYRLARLNNRTHRELLVVDGKIAFVGGAGIADWWAAPTRGARWRDTMAQVEGPVVATLQGVVAENWLECCGEILMGEEYFPPLARKGDTTAFVVKSSPADRATVSRVAFQLLIENAERRVRIITPYFLPDRTLRQALARTAARGVEVEIIVPGSNTDQRLVRLASRRLYGGLLRCGIRIYEYEPGMMHAKILLVDDDWAVVGTTNIDNRSFEHNDEVNLAMLDRVIAARLHGDFARDLQDSRQIALAEWRRRPFWQRGLDWIVWILERQQ